MSEGTERKKIRPLTANQCLYWQSIFERQLTVCTGPAGSGKTLLACTAAAELLEQGKILRIVLCRPLVSCGKEFGWLPGDLNEKLLPWMAPLVDSFESHFGPEVMAKLFSEGKIQIKALEMLRGSSFKNSFIILDEAQNALYDQLRMFLTRIGNSKVVVTGDYTQHDLHIPENPLKEVILRLSKTPNKDIGIIRLKRSDILRSALVRFIEDSLGPNSGHLIWEDIYCPKCRAECWFQDDPEDKTYCVRCHSCQAIIWLPDDLNQTKKYRAEHRKDFPQALAANTCPKPPEETEDSE